MKEKIHLVYQPDGNRRYAKIKDISLRDAYELSLNGIISLAGWFFDYDCAHELSIHALDRYNLQRPFSELAPLKEVIALGINRIRESRAVKEKDLDVRVVGRISDICGSGLEDTPLAEANLDNRKLNILVSYDANEELKKAIFLCLRDDVSISFENLSTRWSISPVSLILRTSQLPTSTRISTYFPGIDQARLLSTSTPPQELTKDEFDKLIQLYLSLRNG